MRKLMLALTVAMSGAMCSPAIKAQTNAPIQGYYRVQNVATGHYVEVRGPFTTAPDVDLDYAHTSAGTVMRLRAVPDARNNRYVIGNLSSQGIEVLGAPQADYMATLMELAEQINFNDFTGAAYTLQREAAGMGYIATGRMVIEALFQVVAERLDSEIENLPAETKASLGIGENETDILKNFAIRFNREVSANIDLNAYLEPIDETAGTYRLYFNWIDCEGVSGFYLANEQNKREFEIGFECMRQYMNGKNGLGTGQTVDDAEAALWRSWGYDLNDKYSSYYDAAAGVYNLTYEMIFADHQLLYNWLKMYIQRFLDPEKAPNAEVLGINFRDFAAEMQKHEIMNGFLKYIPSIQENQRLYLTSGRYSDGVNEFSTVGTVSDNSNRFGLLATAQADAAGNAAVWKLCPISSTGDNYFALSSVADRINQEGADDSRYISTYLDFPVQILSDNVTVRRMGESIQLKSIELENLGHIDYIEIGDADENLVPRRTCTLLEIGTPDQNSDYIVDIVWEAQDTDYDPDVDSTPGGLGVSGDVTAAGQRAPRGETTSADQASYCGVLLPTQVSENILNNSLGLNLDLRQNSVYSLSTREDKTSAVVPGKTMSTPWFAEAQSLPANHAFIVAPRQDTSGSDRSEAGISLGLPEDENDSTTGIESIGIGVPVADNVLYDLQGRVVNSVRSGCIYILNGKKILVR